MSIIRLKPFEIDINKAIWCGKPVKSLTRDELLTAFVETASLLVQERENLAKTSRLLEFYLTNAKEGEVVQAADFTTDEIDRMMVEAELLNQLHGEPESQ